MKLNDNNSLLLQIGDLKLSDTEYTFGKHKIVGNFEYTPLNENNNQVDTSSQLGLLVTGDHRLGAEISCNGKKIFIVYGANRPSSNAQNIAIGFFTRTKYHFIKEWYSDIYNENPELTSRSIITVDSLFNNTQVDEKIVFHKYNKTPKITEKDEKFFINWVKNIKIFETAFSKEQLISLNKIRFRALKSNDEKQKYLKYHQL